MRNLIFCLDAERCADGVEWTRRDPPGVKWLSRAGPIWFSWRSNRHERFEQQADLGDPLVIRFLNASNEDKLTEFLSTFGLPDGFLLRASRRKRPVAKFLSVEDLPDGWVLGASGADLPAEPRNFVRAMQRRLRRLLEDAASNNATRKDKAAQHALHFAVRDSNASAVDGRVVLTARTLIAFMHFEVYMTAENGAYIGRCKRCRCLFLYGQATRRRSTGTYCSGRCRIAAHRATKRGS
jgi:hypothetical protein